MSEREAGQVLTSENSEAFYANRLGLAEEAPVEAVVEETPTEPTEEAIDQNEPQPEETKETETKATEEKKPNPKLEKRFSELTKARKLAEETAAKEREQRESLEAKLKEYEAKSNPKSQVEEDVEPQPSQFTDAFEYAKALAEYSAEQALKNRDKQEAEKKAKEEYDNKVSAWQKRLLEVKSELPDFDDMVQSATVQVPDYVTDAILESEQGPKILYHLAENDELAQEIAGMPMIKALRTIGRLEARFEAKETPKEAKAEAETKPSVAKSKAPAPISPIKTSSAVADVGVGSDGEFHGTYQQWRESRKAGKIR